MGPSREVKGVGGNPRTYLVQGDHVIREKTRNTMPEKGDGQVI